jgi:hypothetical protein
MTTSPQALAFEADRTVFLDGAREDFSLAVSPKALADRHWPRSQPGSLQLERAIDDVEIAIMQAGLRHAERGALLATASLRQLLPDLLPPGAQVTRDDVEGRFTRLAASALAADRGGAGPESAGESAAALVLLREVMHHLGFSALATRD